MNKRALNIVVRYILLLIFPVYNLWIFYFLFSPLTIYPVFFLLKLFFNVSISSNVINIDSFSINIVKACIAGSAYYLLLILNLTTPMNLKKRILSIVYSFMIFLIINILRIFFFSIIFTKSFSIFNLTHLIFWYFLSSLIVFLIWIIQIRTFKIKEIPVYSDLKYLYFLIKK